MSFQEKSAWVVLLVSALVFAPYAWTLVTENPPAFAHGPMIFGVMVGFTVLITFSHIILAIVFPKAASAPADERDRRIELHGEHAGGFMLGLWSLGAIVFALMEGAPRVATVIFLGLAISEFVKSLWQVALYRKGA